MKNHLYRKGKVHPSSSSPPRPTAISDHLALLPATIMTLTVALSPQDREVLAYLISSCNNNTASTNFSGHRNQLTHKSTTNGGGGEHGTKFDCDCFKCYMSYWVRWDTSPNRQLIHEIIDAYEEGVFDDQKKNMKNKKQRKKRVYNNSFTVNSAVTDKLMGELESVEVPSCGVGGGGGGGDEVVGLDEGSVRKLVSYIGEKIWGGWSKL